MGLAGWTGSLVTLNSDVLQAVSRTGSKHRGEHPGARLWPHCEATHLSCIDTIGSRACGGPRSQIGFRISGSEGSPGSERFRRFQTFRMYCTVPDKTGGPEVLQVAGGSKVYAQFKEFWRQRFRGSRGIGGF